MSIHFDFIINTHVVSPYGPLFGRLPMELRILVWIDVLVSSGTIAKAHSFMRPQEPLVVANFPPAKDIDAALLRTCRAIYEETFPILYGNNSFVFYHTSEITEFAFGKLYFPFGRHLLDSPLGQALKCNVRIPAIGITGVAGCISQSLTPMIPLLTTRIDTNIYAGKTFDASFHDFEVSKRHRKCNEFPVTARRARSRLVRLGRIPAAIIRAAFSHLSCAGRLAS